MSEKIKSTQEYLRIYDIVMAVLSLLGLVILAVVGVFTFMFTRDLAPDLFNDPNNLITGIIIGISGIFVLFSLIIHVIAIFNVRKTGNFAFWIQVASLACGLTSFPVMIASILLLIRIFEKEVKDYYTQPTIAA
jgi:hypothetical protein